MTAPRNPAAQRPGVAPLTAEDYPAQGEQHRYRAAVGAGRRPRTRRRPDRRARAHPTVPGRRTAYLEGQSLAALAREHSVSRGAVRTAVADLLPKHVTDDEPAPAPKLPITLDMPGKAADLLRTTELDDVERAALDHGQAVRRGTGHTVRVTAVPAVHRQLLDLARVVDGPLPVPRASAADIA